MARGLNILLTLRAFATFRYAPDRLHFEARPQLPYSLISKLLLVGVASIA